MKNKIVNMLFEKKYKDKTPHLCKNKIEDFITHILNIIFPQMGQFQFIDYNELLSELKKNEDTLKEILSCLGKEFKSNCEKSQNFVDSFYFSLESIENDLTKDAEFIASEDPAAHSLNEVIICYPGFYAIAVYRIANFFYKNNIPLFPRVLSELAHQKTGIDIHPGAKINSPFFIDHGTGIVIGETTRIGKKVKIFQGVTLGALSVKRKLKSIKRHPTIGDGTIIYANATILGGETIIGKNSIVGGNVWLTESIPENSSVHATQITNIKSK